MSNILHLIPGTDETISGDDLVAEFNAGYRVGYRAGHRGSPPSSTVDFETPKPRPVALRLLKAADTLDQIEAATA